MNTTGPAPGESPGAPAFDVGALSYGQVLRRRGGGDSFGRKPVGCCVAAGMPRAFQLWARREEPG